MKCLLTCGFCPNSGWLVSELNCSSKLRLQDNTSRKANSKIMCENCYVVAKSCPTLLRPHGLYSLPFSSVHGIFQARILEWVAMSFLRGSSWPRDQTWVSCSGKQILYYWATRETMCKNTEHNLGLGGLQHQNEKHEWTTHVWADVQFHSLEVEHFIFWPIMCFSVSFSGEC